MNTKPKTKRTPDKVVFRTVVSEKTKGLDFILSDATPDRYDDIIMTSGWELENFNKNPIALFAHMGSFPVGTWKDVRVEENALRGTLVLAKEGTSDRIDEIRKLVDANILRAVSVGFQPLEYEERKGDTYGLVYTRQELVECSLVSVPANPNALQVAKELKISADTQGVVFRKNTKIDKIINGSRHLYDVDEEIQNWNIKIAKLEFELRETHFLSDVDNHPTLKGWRKRRKLLEEERKRLLER